MRQTACIGIIALLAALLVIGACAQAVGPTGQATNTKEPVRIGLLGPMTGEAASWGLAAKLGIEIAIEDINAEGGINGRPVELVVEEDGCSPKSGTAAAKLITIDDVDAIIGPVCSAAAGAALPLLVEQGIPVVLSVASAPGLTKTGTNVFRTTPADNYEGVFLAEYAKEQYGLSAAFVYSKNEWGQGIHDEFVKNYQQLGGLILVDEATATEQRDFRTVIEKINEAQADVIVVGMYPAAAISFLKQLHEQGIVTPVWSGDAIQTEEVKQAPEAEGLKFASPYVSFPDWLKQRVKAKGGEEHVAVPMSYDAMMTLADAMRKVGTEKQAVIKALAATHRDGISTPVIEFDENRDLKEVSYEVKMVKDGQFVIVE